MQKLIALYISSEITTVQFKRYVSLEGGANNLFDRNYALAEGFPEAGRNFFVNLLLTNL